LTLKLKDHRLYRFALFQDILVERPAMTMPG